MVITIFSEPRSGSYAIHDWFKKAFPDYICLFESFNRNAVDYNPEFRTFNWLDKSKNYIISEKYLPFENYQRKKEYFIKLVEESDIIVAIYREDEEKQLESFLFATSTQEWFSEYVVNETSLKNLKKKNPTEVKMYHTHKRVFKEFREEYGFKTFTYEELFYGNKFDELKEYVGLKSDLPFPQIKKYRKDTKEKFLI